MLGLLERTITCGPLHFSHYGRCNVAARSPFAHLSRALVPEVGRLPRDEQGGEA